MSGRAFQLSKLEVWHNKTRAFRMLTVWLEERLAGHGQQIADAGDRRRLRQVYRTRPESGSHTADTYILERTAWTGSGQWRRASVVWRRPEVQRPFSTAKPVRKVDFG